MHSYGKISYELSVNTILHELLGPISSVTQSQ